MSDFKKCMCGAECAANGLANLRVSEEKNKLNAVRTSLLNTSFVAILFLVASFVSAEYHANTALFLMVIFVFLGLYVFIGTMETTILRNLMGLKASLIAWVVLFAYFAYVAKAQAVSDINSLFHIDASLLPMTVFAATLLQVLNMLYWPVIGMSIIILVVAYLWRHEFVGSHEGFAIVLTLVISVVAQVIFTVMVWGWVDTPGQRRSIIYRIAHFADFNSSYRCMGLDESKFSVVFIDPAKTRVLIAPKIPESSSMPGPKATWLQPLTIPREFPQRSCIAYVYEQEP